MIQTIHFQNYRNSEFVQFIKNALGIVQSHNPDELQISEPYGDTAERFSILEGIFKQARGSEITTELQEIDKKRDNALIGIATALDALTYHFDETKKMCAQKLIESMELYGKSLSRLPYQSETSVINAIVQKWESDEELQNAVASLNLSEWMTEMKNTNTLFDELFLSRIKEEANDPEITVAALRKEVTELFRNLQDHITAHAIISDDEKYDALIKEINILTESYNRTALERTSTNKEEATAGSAGSQEESN